MPVEQSQADALRITWRIVARFDGPRSDAGEFEAITGEPAASDREIR